MATIRARGKAWQVQIRLAGCPAITRTFPSKREAEEFAALNETGIRYQGQSADKFRRTIGEAIALYREHAGAKLTKFDHGVLDFWNERLGAIRLAHFSMARFLAVRAELARKPAERGDRIGEPISPATLNRRIARLSAVFRFAARTLKWLDQHPFQNADGIWAKEKGRRSKEQVLLTDDEFERLITACRASASPMLAPFVLLQACTGCRTSELQRLRWADVNLERGFALILDSKNGEPRAVPIVGDAVAELRALKSSRKVGALDGSDLVFHAAEGTTTPFDPRHWWKKARDAAGLGKNRGAGQKPFILHGFRHRMATALMNSKIADTKGAAITGHKTLSVYRRYQHLLADEVTKTGQLIEHVLLPKRARDDA